MVGISLIELILAMLLGNMVVVLAMQSYNFIQHAIIQIEARLDVLKKFDLAVFYLQQDIQAAGYRGARSCDPILLDLNYGKSSKQLFNTEPVLAIEVLNTGIHQRSLPAKITKKVLQQKIPYNAEILVLNDVPKASYSLAINMADPCDALQIARDPTLFAGETMAITSTTAIERFIASSIVNGRYIYHQLPVNKQSCFYQTYPENTEIVALQQIAYYLAKPDLAADTYTLYRDDLVNTAQSIIDGVEDLHMTLVAPPVAAANVQPNGVVIELLVRAANKSNKSQQLWWRNKLINFNDGFVRRALVVKMALRNVC